MIQHIHTFIKFLWLGNLQLRLRKLLWELPQNMVGFIVMLVFAMQDKVVYSEKSEGVLVIVTKGRWGAVSLGHIIIGSSSISPIVGNHLFMHEFGHTLQSRVLGPLYLLVVGIPSLTSVLFRGKSHHESYVERYTNTLAFNYFNGKYLLEHWDVRNYPMTQKSANIT